MGPYENRPERLDVNKLIVTKRSERRREGTRQDGAGRDEKKTSRLWKS